MRYLIALGALLFALNLSAQSALINEINYAATDPTGRGVEIVAEAGSDLDGWSVAIYMFNGHVTRVLDLSDAVIPNQQSGYGTVWYEVVQNDNGGGAALVDPTGTVQQFISFGSATVLAAANGPAAGTLAEYIGVSPPGGALTLVGEGYEPSDFFWAPALLSSPGSINTDQIFLILLAKSISQTTVSGRSIPNPFVDRITTFFDKPLVQRGTLSVFDMRGVLLQQVQLVPGQIDAQLQLGSVPTGMYVLRFQSGEEQWTQLLQH